MKPLTIKELADLYTKSPDFTVLSPNTKKSYLAYLDMVVETGGQIPLQYESNLIHTVTQGSEWFKTIQATGWPNYTQNGVVGQIKRLFSWGIEKLGLPADTSPATYMPKLKHEKKDSNPFTPDEIKKIQNHRIIFGTKYAPLKLTEQETIVSYMVEFLFETGMRPGEVFNLKLHDVVLDDHQSGFKSRDRLIQIMGAKGKEKGKVSRYISVTPQVDSLIKIAIQHRHSRKNVKCDNLWVSMQGKKIDHNNFAKSFKNLMVKVGLLDKQIYDLRRGCATEIINNPAYGLNVAQKQLGHASINTTMIYEKLSKKRAARMFRGHN